MYRYQESDLDVWSKVAVQNEHTLIHSIDTDMVLILFATAHQMYKNHVWLVLKNEAYNAKTLVASMTDSTVVGKLNIAFWMMTLGTDYNASLTTVGYYTKDIVELIESKPTTPFKKTGENQYTFALSRALQHLPKKVCKKKNVKAHVCNLLARVAVSVQYYGKWWNPITHPSGPDLPNFDAADESFTLVLQQ